MKLVDLLVQELPKRGGWPEEAKIMSQDAAGLINAHRNERLVFLIDQFWTGTSKNDACKNFSPFYLKKATDWNTNTVTREQYESALADSKAVVGHNGWIQWAGGECPVDSDAIVEVKYRKPNPYQFNNDRAGGYIWLHTGSDGDIIAYRLHRDIDSRANDYRLEQDLNECIGQDFDVVNHPSHYTKGRIECIDAIDSATTGKSGIEAVCVANVIRYLWRYEEKGGLESVRKAKWYLNKLISELEDK